MCLTKSCSAAWLVRTRWPLYLVLMVFAAFMVGCDSSSDNDDDAALGGSLRFVNAVVGAPALGMEISESDQGAVSYGQSSGALSLLSGSKPLTFYQIEPDGDIEYLDLGFDYTLDDGSETIIVLFGSMDDLQYTVVEADAFDLDDGTARVGLLVVSAGQPSLDLYVTELDEGVYDTGPMLMGEYGVFTGMADAAEGDYSVRFTLPAEKEIVFDAGEVELDEDSNYIYLVMDYGSDAVDRLQVLEINADASARSLLDEDVPADLRFINAIADSPSVDVYLGDTAGEPLFSNVAFGETTGYFELEVDDYNVNVTPHGVKDQFFYQGQLSLVAGQFTSLVTAGSSMDDDVRGTVIADSLQSITDGGEISFVHASPGNGEIDVYLLLPGQPFYDTSPLVANLSYLLAYDEEIEAGDYELMLIQSENDATILGPLPLSIEHGDVLDLYFMDSEGGGTPGQLEVFEF